MAESKGFAHHYFVNVTVYRSWNSRPGYIDEYSYTFILPCDRQIHMYNFDDSYFWHKTKDYITKYKFGYRKENQDLNGAWGDGYSIDFNTVNYLGYYEYGYGDDDE